MLLQIREFFCREKIASNQQVARIFKLDLSALEPMLAIWLRKGVLAYAEQTAKAACGSRCATSSCLNTSIIYYRYIE